MLQTISGENLLESLFDGVYFVDSNMRIIYWNAAAERIAGYRKDEMIGSRCDDNILQHIDSVGCQLCKHGCPLSATLKDGTPKETSMYLHHKLGHRVPVSVRTSPVRNEEGDIIGAVEIFSDNSNSLQILHEFEKLKQDAYLDLLTGVGNRRYGEMTLTTRILDLHNHDIAFGVLFVDIDNFKRFNDEHGHKIGDDVLVMVAKSISVSLRKMDVVARWGGEEFVVLLPGANSVIARSVSERIRVLIENSYIRVGEQRLHVTVSIGTTMSGPDDTTESIIHRADRYMYISKNRGRNRVTDDENNE